MNCLTLEKPGHWRTSDPPAPDAPSAGEALVRVRRVGVCGTDIHAYRGEQPFFSYPRILGHELGVEVVAVGEGVTDLSAGDRCAVEPYLTCGICPPCRLGRTNCCESLQCLGVHTDGGMREQICLPADKLHRSATLDYEVLALVETLNIGRHAVVRSGIDRGARCAVLGLGPIGLTVATFAKLAGADVVGLDISGARAETASRLTGIETLVLDPGEPIAAQWAGRYPEAPRYVFEATGNRASMLNAFELPGHAGQLVLVGLVLGELCFDAPAFHRRELTLMSSRCGTAADFTAIIALMEAGRIDPAAWVTHRCELNEVPGVFESWLRPDAGLLKGMVSID